MDLSFGQLTKSLGSFFKKQDGVLGLDIGTSFIKAVQLRKEKERAILETYGEIAIGPYANLQIGQAAKITQEAAVGAINDVLKEANAKAKKAAVAIPLSSTFITTIDLPLSEESVDISEIVQVEARRHIPVPISEVSLDWWVIPGDFGKAREDEKKKTTQVLLVAIHKDVLGVYKDIVSAAGLEAEIYEIESFSSIRSCLGKESSATAILDFGASSTKMTIVDYGIIRVSYSINQGSQNLTLALSRSLGIDFSRAEEMKREVGLSDLPEHKEIVKVLEPVLDYIFSEVNRFIGDFQRKSGRSVGKIILAGGGALLKGLIDFSVRRTTIEVGIADPFAKVEYPAFLSKVLKETGASFSTAVGLALRGL